MSEQTPLPKRCEEKAALLRAYDKAVTVYGGAVADLSRAVGAALHAEYELIQRKVALARKLSEEARDRLQDHEKEHNCSGTLLKQPIRAIERPEAAGEADGALVAEQHKLEIISK